MSLILSYLRRRLVKFKKENNEHTLYAYAVFAPAFFLSLPRQSLTKSSGVVAGLVGGKSGAGVVELEAGFENISP